MKKKGFQFDSLSLYVDVSGLKWNVVSIAVLSIVIQIVNIRMKGGASN